MTQKRVDKIFELIRTCWS